MLHSGLSIASGLDKRTNGERGRFSVSLPLNIVSLGQQWYEKKQQEQHLGPMIPHVLEMLEESEYAVCILSCRAKEGWRESIAGGRRGAIL
jgi:hypothetical protein